MSAPAWEALPGLRVRELVGPGSTPLGQVAVAFAGMVARRLGAQVERAVAAGGDDALASGALRLPDGSGALHRFLGAGKRTVALAEPPPAGTFALTDDAALAAAWPDERQVLVRPTLSDPGRWQSGLTAMAATGLLDIVGEPGRPPLPLPGHQVAYAAGLAALDGLLANAYALADGRPAQRTEVACTEVASWVNWKNRLSAVSGSRQTGRDRPEEWRTVACRDGHVAVIFRDRDIPAMARLLRCDRLLSEDFRTEPARVRNLAAFHALVAQQLAHRGRDELLREAGRLNLQFAAVLEPRQVFDDPQMRHRAFFVDADGLRMPRLPLLGRWSPVPATPPRHRAGAAGCGRLAGVRVLDLGIVTAGASTSALLADLGAEVIKVEGPSYTDPFREWSGRSAGAQWWNESPQFQATNRNKRSVCMDLKSPRGRALFLQLVASCDVLLENFRAGVLARLKLDAPHLHAVHPSLVLASISSQGQDGPQRDSSSFGSTLEASSGLAALMRHAGGAPQITGRGMNYPDQVAALFSAAAIMAALVERRRSGRGAVLDLSQRELTAFLVGEALLAAGAEAGPGVPPPDPAWPGTVEGLFRAGDGQWVAVTVPAGGLREAPPDLGMRPAPDALKPWLAARRAAAAARCLRAAGAAAEVVWTARGFDDPAALVPLDAYALDSAGRQVKGLPLRFGGCPPGPYRAAPALGQDNADVARSLLGLDATALRALVAEGVFADRPADAG